MNKEKFRKSIDEIHPSEELIRKTLMNIENKKKRNFMPFYVTAVSAVCSIVIITTFVINNTGTTINKTNNNFLNEIKGEYTFEHIFDFNALPKDQFDNIYVLKHENKIEDNDYVIPYESYIEFIEIIEPLKDNYMNTKQDFKEDNYDKVVINNQKYFYVGTEDLVFFDTNNNIHYSIDITNDTETLNKIKDYITKFTRMRSIENFIEQTHINTIKESTYRGMFIIEKTTKSGQWEKYSSTGKYSDYKELMTYIEKLRYNNVIKNEKPFDVSKYYGNMLIYFEGYYMHIPENINGKILLYVPGWINTIYYEIELEQKDYNTLESIKEFIKTKGTYTNAFDRYNPETNELVDPNRNNTYQFKQSVDPETGANIISQKFLLYYAEVGIEGNNNLYIKFEPDNIKNSRYEPMDTSKIENNPKIIIDEHIRDYNALGINTDYYETLVYVTRDKKIKKIAIKDIIQTGDTSTAVEIPVGGKVNQIEERHEENKMVLYAVLENGTKVKLDK